MNRLVHIDFRKWLHRRHWQFTMNWLAEDDWGLWLWTPSGSTAQRADEAPQVFNHNNVKLVSPGAWWTAIWNDGDKFDLYIDIITPAAIGPDRVTMIDLDLDVIRNLDGTAFVDDRDEFEEHQLLYKYPQYVVDMAMGTAVDLKGKLEAREEPFEDVGARMMERARAFRSFTVQPWASPGSRADRVHDPCRRA